MVFLIFGFSLSLQIIFLPHCCWCSRFSLRCYHRVSSICLQCVFLFISLTCPHATIMHIYKNKRAQTHELITSLCPTERMRNIVCVCVCAATWASCDFFYSLKKVLLNLIYAIKYGRGECQFSYTLEFKSWDLCIFYVSTYFHLLYYLFNPTNTHVSLNIILCIYLGQHQLQFYIPIPMPNLAETQLDNALMWMAQFGSSVFVSYNSHYYYVVYITTYILYLYF